jgi:uncharacterized protein
LESLERLDKVIPGVNSDSMLLYALEIKFYVKRVKTDCSLGTSLGNLWVAGAGTGLSSGRVGAAAMGIIAA